MSFHHLSLSFKVAIQLLLEIWERKSLGMRYHISLTRKKWLLICQTGNEIWNHLYQQKTGVGVCFCRWMESERKPRTMESLPRDLPFVLSMEWKHFFFFFLEPPEILSTSSLPWWYIVSQFFQGLLCVRDSLPKFAWTICSFPSPTVAWY